jgi:hypothetical protein
MTNEVTPFRLPWEPAPIADTVKALQTDMAYIVAYTGVIVHSNREELRAQINTRRGQIVPHGVCKLSEGVTIEFQDIGMPQIGSPEMTVQELMTQTLETASMLGLEIIS